MIAFCSERMRAHEPGRFHVERPERLDAVRAGLDGLVQWRDAPEADPACLRSVHDSAYVDRILGLRGDEIQLDPDTHLSEFSVEAALRAAGGALHLVDALMHGETELGWALVRPPGHHAERARAMGFCVFNNVAVAVQRAIEHHGAQRVAVIDWDVHHGNGTQHSFEHRDDVLFYSSHRYGRGFYPGTGGLDEQGEGRGLGLTVNAPLWEGAGDRDIVDALVGRFLPVARDFAPDLVLVSAGFDAHIDDPIGGLRVTESGFRELALRVMELASHAGAPRLGLVLEGGYDLGGLERSVRVVAESLRGG